MERNIGFGLIALAALLYLPFPIQAVFAMTAGSWLVVRNTRGFIRAGMILVALFFSFVSVWFALGILL